MEDIKARLAAVNAAIDERQANGTDEGLEFRALIDTRTALADKAWEFWDGKRFMEQRGTPPPKKKVGVDSGTGR